MEEVKENRQKYRDKLKASFIKTNLSISPTRVLEGSPMIENRKRNAS
jgi:hypothetical protein